MRGATGGSCRHQELGFVYLGGLQTSANMHLSVLDQWHRTGSSSVTVGDGETGGE